MDEEYKKEKIVNNLCLDNTNLKLEIRKLKKELAIKEVEINDLKEKKLDLSEEDLNNNFYQFSPISFSAINSEYSDQKIVYQLKNAFDTINSLQKEKDKEADLSERKIKELNNEIQKIKQDRLSACCRLLPCVDCCLTARLLRVPLSRRVSTPWNCVFRRTTPILVRRWQSQVFTTSKAVV